MTTLKVKQSIVLRRSIEDVFEFVATGFFENRAKWVPEIIYSELISGGPMQKGVTGRQLTRDGAGRVTETIYTVTDYEMDKRFAVQGVATFVPTESQPAPVPSPPTRFSGCYYFEPVAADTRLTFQYEYDVALSTFHRLTRPLWIGRFAENSEKYATNLKTLLEAAAGLPLAKKPFHLRGSWIWPGFYLLAFITLFWLYVERTQLQLSPAWIQILQVALVIWTGLGVLGLFVRRAFR